MGTAPPQIRSDLLPRQVSEIHSHSIEAIIAPATVNDDSNSFRSPVK
jgi:hypothetical protein